MCYHNYLFKFCFVLCFIQIFVCPFAQVLCEVQKKKIKQLDKCDKKNCTTFSSKSLKYFMVKKLSFDSMQ